MKTSSILIVRRISILGKNEKANSLQASHSASEAYSKVFVVVPLFLQLLKVMSIDIYFSFYSFQVSFALVSLH